MEMIKCKTCGKTISESNSTCPYCGDKIVKILCPKCSSVNVGIDVKFKSKFNVLHFLIIYTVGLIPFLIYKALTVGKGDRVKYVCQDCGKKFKI